MLIDNFIHYFQFKDMLKEEFPYLHKKFIEDHIDFCELIGYIEEEGVGCNYYGNLWKYIKQNEHMHDFWLL